MPKIIENLPQKLMDEARRQIQSDGYAATTIRSVAKACGVGVGTVYNYYPSKDALVAAFILEDWQSVTDRINAVSETSDTVMPVLESMYTGLNRFASAHSAVFQDNSAAAAYAGSLSRYHGLLRGQLAAPVRKFCPDDFSAEFVYEAMLTWTIAGKSLEEISALVTKLM